MTQPYYQDDSVTLYHGDSREVSEWLDAHVLITDPPYGRAWKQGDANKPYGWRTSAHEGIVGDENTEVRDIALERWRTAALSPWRPAIVFGDLMLAPPAGTKHVLIYDKGNDAGMRGAVGGYRRNVEAIYLMGEGHGATFGGRPAILSTRVSAGGNLSRTTGHPHTKPLDVMCALMSHAPAGVVADPFAGSGATLVAAKLAGRKAIGVEIDERYCETIAKRLAQDVLTFA